jgi:hypothetical protein
LPLNPTLSEQAHPRLKFIKAIPIAATVMSPVIRTFTVDSGKITSIDMQNNQGWQALPQPQAGPPAMPPLFSINDCFPPIALPGHERLAIARSRRREAGTGWLCGLAFAVLGLFVADAGAAEFDAETCTQIRAQIGVLPVADPVLLRKLAFRSDCRFTAGEAYRAAHGDRPPAKWEAEGRQRHGREDHDD